MSASSFVHLRVHSEYSIQDGTVRFHELCAQLKAQGAESVAVADLANLFGAVKLFQTAKSEKLKPIIGAELWFQAEGAPISRLVLLCQNAAGYRNLSQLLTEAYQKPHRQSPPILPLTSLKGRTQGLIALSGALHSDIAAALLSDDRALAERCLRFWMSAFPQCFYVEIQRIGAPREEVYLTAAISLAAACQCPVVATNAVCFLTPGDFDAHEVRVCVQSGWVLSDPKRPHLHTQAQYLKSAEEMMALFADVPGALQNSVEISRRCHFKFSLGHTAFPDFPVPEGMTPETYLQHVAQLGLVQRFEDTKIVSALQPEYQARLDLELSVIMQMGFVAYFLIVYDFIRWAKEQDIPVGPGRGSGAGSLVAYALGITDVDPITYHLLFERFLNPERVSLPDFDIDFCMTGRDRVIDYVVHRYGPENVCQIATFGTMAARAVLRDVGRVLGIPYGFVDKIAKLVPMELGVTLEKALAQEPQLQALCDAEEEVQTLMNLARRLEGTIRSVGRHAGGVVISPKPLIEYTPLYFEPDGGLPVTQFDKDDAESIGLLKFDFLGLRNLTIIQSAVRMINQGLPDGEKPIDIRFIPFDDPDTYALLKRGETTAIFQLESRGMKDLILRLQPDSFEEIIALIALFRPGPLQSGMVDDFIARKQGEMPVIYPHESLEPILEPTYGVILYQEQVMQIAQVLAGYTLGSADLLRRAMGKKKPEEMAVQRAIFLRGAADNQVPESNASAIFDIVEKFAGYGFNKSHSAAYAIVSYQTAWLKAHYPEAFMAAVLSADMAHTDKLVIALQECHRMGIQILSPDVQHSLGVFTLAGPKKIRLGLGALKGMGHLAIEAICENRPTGGFTSFFSLVEKTHAHMNKRMWEALIRSGGCDGLGHNRATWMHYLPDALRAVEQQREALKTQQRDLFGAFGAAAPQAPECVPQSEWPMLEKLT
ncbi:MAG: DNA polymerase III subunit alpha, partial [Pseudomonadota bacterium]